MTGHAFGWCLTGHHPDCRTAYDFHGTITTCNCTCHHINDTTGGTK